MSDQALGWLLILAICWSAISGMMSIWIALLLRNRLFDLESMVIWKWSEAPWWTRIDEDETFHMNLAKRVQALESAREFSRAASGQSISTNTEN